MSSARRGETVPAYIDDLQRRIAHLEAFQGGQKAEMEALGRDMKLVRSSQESLSTKVDNLIVQVTQLQATRPVGTRESMSFWVGTLSSVAALIALTIGGLVWLVQHSGGSISREELKAAIVEMQAPLRARETKQH